MRLRSRVAGRRELFAPFALCYDVHTSRSTGEERVMTTTRLRFHLLLAAAALGASSALLASPPSGGGGGGGGGSSPSMSGAQYDAAAEYRKGMDALQAEHYQDAKKAFEHVLSVAPSDANTNFLAGLAAAGLGDLKSARKFYERAVRSDKDLVQAHREL